VCARQGLAVKGRLGAYPKVERNLDRWGIETLGHRVVEPTERRGLRGSPGSRCGDEGVGSGKHEKSIWEK
jgi:hypothetical protein